ncbi:LysR substrate-binding domain-containing protein [uncultured Sphingomonas sp.]|uniref:LysR substrate-binding domain-containing protein n=1 Tax=uncultured Sphingomonas sp. TaxID=158754 RepID=UPI0026225209|nr:LysR substrate-binding domain-containing protein [uncultured Sphingomonas sp.]
MAPRLPPLNAVRAFESAGRNQSFTLAADELHVTSGAISRQIHTLEDHLGFELFRRSHREVRLTPEAAAYLETVSDALERIERGTSRLVDARKQRLLHIHNSITFTLRWLVPRLSGFHAAYPKTEIRLSTALPSAAELIASPTDVSIQIRDEASVQALSTLQHDRLIDIELSPVCSPEYRDRLRLRGGVESFKDVTLLHSMMRPNDWRSWLGLAGDSPMDPSSGIKFESSSLALQAAVEGVGVSIATRLFVTKELENGTLVTPYDLVFRDGSGFYLSYSQAAAQLPHVAEFRDWITGEARRSPN